MSAIVSRIICLQLLLVVLLVSGAQSQTAEDIQLDTGTGVLQGTLLIPEGPGPFPVVLIISGSGPTDRDGNSAMLPGKNNSLRQLAVGLAAAKVASVRYDKRGVAASMMAGLSEKDLRFDHYISDAVLWCRRLQADSRFSSVTVAGHSEGAQIGVTAAWLAAADGYVSLAGPGRPVFAILREQLAKNLPMRNRVKAEAVMDSLEVGKLVAEPPAELMILFRPSVQPYLISWQNHDPQQSIARYDGPVAIVQGATDVQVSLEDAELLAAAQPRARLVIIEGANHIFKPLATEAPIAHQMSLADSTTTIDPQVVQIVAEVSAQAEQYHAAKMKALEQAREVNSSQLEREAWPTVSSGGEVGHWARYFLSQEKAAYLFGLADGGYAQQGLLVKDTAFDCVSFMYRCTELARAQNPDDALLWALRTRFAGADPTQVVNDKGRVDYDRPEHLDFSLDMIRTGIWGRDITPALTGAVADDHGSSRYAPGSFLFVPKADLVPEELKEGDIVWLVLDSGQDKGAALRENYGLVIGHIGIVLVEPDGVYLAHAAGSALPGHYEEPGLVAVPLVEYLTRVEKFAGVMITRL